MVNQNAESKKVRHLIILFTVIYIETLPLKQTKTYCSYNFMK